MKKIILFGFLFNSFLAGFAQFEHTLGLMDNVYQGSYTNPSIIPQHKVSIGLPMISSGYTGITNTGFTFNQLYNSSTNTLEIGDVIGKLKKKNMIYAGLNEDLFHLRIKIRNAYVSFNVQDKAEVRFSYPKDLLSLAWDGNYQYVNKTADFSSLGLDGSYYRSYGLSYVRESKKWNFGGRIKILQGLANVHLDNSKTQIKIAPETYNHTLIADATLYTSGIDRTEEDSDVAKVINNWQNRGLGLDLGATYKMNDKWQFSGSLINLGFISWKSYTHHYSVKGETTFRGMEYSNKDEEVDVLDSLKEDFKVSESKGNYTTGLYPQLYLRARYNLFNKTSLHASLSVEKYKALHTGLTLAASQQVGRVFNVILSYTYQYRNFNNFGVGVMFKPGPFQFYLVSDNIIRTYTQFNDGIIIPKNAKALNLRLGMNLVFGRVKGQEKQSIPN